MASPRIELGLSPRQRDVLPLDYEAKPPEGIEPSTLSLQN